MSVCKVRFDVRGPDRTLAEEPTALIAHGGVCDGGGSPAFAGRSSSTRTPDIQVHHIGGGQIRAAPRCRNRMTTQVAEHGGTGFCQSSFIPGPAHRLPDARRRELRHHARRLGRRHRGAMRQDAGIHHQQFFVGTGFATEHDPAEAHLGIDLQQQIRSVPISKQ
jgi:hypothetical protein